MAEVVWTRRALADLQAVEAYIAQFSPLAARRFALRLYKAGLALRDQPNRGRAIGPELRELTIASPYLIRYRLRDGVVEILTIRHGAREPEG